VPYIEEIAMIHRNRSILSGLRTIVPILTSFGMAQAATTYTNTWASVDTHDPAPEWFQDAKFGIYFHYGAFTVPAYYSEWYGTYMYGNYGVSSVESHHTSTYGNQFAVPGWGYNNFIAGGKDVAGNWVQFDPKLVSAGGVLDPDSFAQLFVDAGARFAGPVMEHHDGFSMWDSKVNPWNSVDVPGGPELNLAKLWTDAFRNKGLKVLAAMHHAFHFNGFYANVPKQTDPKLILFYAQQSRTAENQLWYDKLKEVIDEFQPDILWQDFDLSAVDQTQLLNFLSYYFNQEAVWGKQVVTTYKDGEDNKCCMYDYERGGAQTLTTPYWLTDDAVSSTSWCYTTAPHTFTLYSTVSELHSLVDHVSKGGNLLLNVSPMIGGNLPQDQVNLLLGMGDWLKRFGESIYSTRPWTYFGEGPTAMGTPAGKMGHPVAGTNKDFRYTRSKDSQTLYAIILGWPGNGASTTFTKITSSAFAVGSKAVVLLPNTAGATPITLKYSQSSSGLTVTMPASEPYNALAYVVRIGPAQLLTTSIQPEGDARSIPQSGWKLTGNGVEFTFASDAPRTLEAFDLRGRTVYRESLQGFSATWNLRNAAGVKLSPGTYAVRVSGPAGVESMIRVPVL
jgi:alpha-L-fucosidase